MTSIAREFADFLKKFSTLEAKAELFVAIGLYVMLTMVVMKSIDKYGDRFFDMIERLFPFIDPMSKVWVFMQIITQFFFTIIAFYFIRTLVNSVVYRIGRHGPGFGMFGKNKAGSVIFAFVLFFTQSNLKEKMKLLVPNL